MSGDERATISFTIDGRPAYAVEGAFVLDVARGMGIEIPTLCHDPALESVGACRLCMVEVTHPDWKGWSGLMTSCLYPVAEGIEVATASEKVLTARRQVLTLLSARCPNAETIQTLAARHGVQGEGLLVDPEADDCILCGLCTRVCDTYATSAITTYNRGATKAIGAFAERAPDDCVGCGACASICPTGNIPDERTGTDYQVWNRSFETAVATVERTRCLGCGSCEEACPFAVARVALHSDGRRVAVIPREQCRGCGACIGACPSGAIDQEHYGRASLLEGVSGTRFPVVACGRADLGRHELPDGVRVIDLPCTGRISGTQLLAGVTRGGDGILVLGRHQESCRLNGAEDPVHARVNRIRAALRTVGFEPDRVRFAVPDPGPEGPVTALREFVDSVSSLGPNPLDGLAPEGLFEDEGLDTDLAVLGWLSLRSARPPDGRAWLAEHGLPAARPGAPALFAGILPYLSILADPLFAPLHLPDALASALAVLEGLGYAGAGVHVGGVVAAPHAAVLGGFSQIFTLSASEEESLAAAGVDAVPLDRILREQAAQLPRSPYSWCVACDGSEEAMLLIDGLGHTPIDVGLDPLPAGFRISPVLRLEAEQRLRDAEAAGAETLLVPDSQTLARWAMITRRGTWRSSRVLPVMAHQLFHLAACGTAPTVRALEKPPARRPQPVGGAS